MTTAAITPGTAMVTTAPAVPNTCSTAPSSDADPGVAQPHRHQAADHRQRAEDRVDDPPVEIEPPREGGHGQRAQDRAGGGGLAWIESHGDIRAAASRLAIHPNTLRYRIRCLAERGIDLTDPDTRLLVWLQLGIRRAAGRTPGGRRG